MLRILADGLHKMVSSAPWFRLQLHLKARFTLRKRTRCLLRLRTKRVETLDSWLAHWCAAEAKIQQGFRQHLQRSPPLQEVLRGRGTIARCVTPVADALKVQVVWELYWILRAQYTHRLKLHWRRALALLAQRQATLQHRCAGRVAPATADFWQGEAVSLRAINAAIFVSLLQEPKFQYTAGRDIKATELLRLANANLEAGSWAGVTESPLGPQGCPTLRAFLRSPLLAEPQWLRFLSKQTVSTVIPPRTWQPTTPPIDGPPASPKWPRRGGPARGQLRCLSGDPEIPVICCDLGDVSPSTSLQTLPSPHVLPSREATPLPPPVALSGSASDGDPGGCGRPTSVSVDAGRPPPSPTTLSVPPAPRRCSGLRAPQRQLSGSPKALRASYDHLFKQHHPEVTAIYPRLPMAGNALALKEPACAMRRRSPPSPRPAAPPCGP
eukprot:EG_transcript_10046